MDKDVATKLAKLLRMLTSSFDGEVLSAVARINGLAAAHDVDWDQALTASHVDLTREQMERVFEAGRQQGRAETGRRDPDWHEASDAPELGERLDEVERIFNAAAQASTYGKITPFEASFVQNMRERIADYGARTYVSPKQWGVINRLRLKLENEGFFP